MGPPLTHDQCRLQMCAACGGKAGARKITPAIGEKIRKWAQPNWSPDVVSFPAGICEQCRVHLTYSEKNNSSDLPGRPGTKERWASFKLENITVPRGQLATKCICQICLARKSNPVGKPAIWKAQIVTSEEETVVVSQVTKPCSKCFQANTGRGIPHSCTPANRKKNLIEIIQNEKGTGTEQILSGVLKDVKEKDKESGGEIRLRQINGGNDLTVTLGKRKLESSGIVDAEIVAKLKKGLDLSSKDTKKALKILRQGNIKVEKCVMDVLDEIGSSLEDEYEDVKMEMEVTKNDEFDEEEPPKKSAKKKEKKKKEIVKEEVDVTIVKDAVQFVEKVMQARGLTEDTVKCRVVPDGGQGSFKISMSVFHKDTDPEIMFSDHEGPSEKMTGVNQLLILAEVDGGLERHFNMRKILEKLQLHRIPGLVVIGDLCILNCMLGISKHGGKHSCYVCEGSSSLECGKLRTFGSLDDWLQKYRDGGSGDDPNCLI